MVRGCRRSGFFFTLQWARAGAPSRIMSTLDTRFGFDGFSRSLSLDYANAVNRLALRSDGQIVIAGADSSNGSILVQLITPSGHIESTWGKNGTVLLNEPPASDSLAGLYVQGNGKILIGFTSVQPMEFASLRLTFAGTLDALYGENGVALVNHAPTGEFDDVISLPDGKILAGGALHQNDADVALLARYNSDGSLDNTFGDADRVRKHNR